MRAAGFILVAAAAFCVSACTSGGGQSCSTATGTQLAPTTWPKFRADPANTGRVQTPPGQEPIDLNDSSGTCALDDTSGNCVVFNGRCSVQSQITCLLSPEGQAGPAPSLCSNPPGQECMPIGAVAASPTVGLPISGFSVLPAIFLGSTDGNVYVVDTEGNPVVLVQPIAVPSAILGTPLIGADGTLFVPSIGRLTQFFSGGDIKTNGSLVGIASASPNIWGGANGRVDGTAFIGTQSGTFTGICPNGVTRFSVVLAPTQSTAAITVDPNRLSANPQLPIVVAGGEGGQVHAYTIGGRQYWSFFAAATITASVMIDPISNLFYVADTAGNVYAGFLVTAMQAPNGQLDPNFSFKTPSSAGILASPALGRDSNDPKVAGRMYVADQGRRDDPEQRGTLYALNRQTGALLWMFEADGPITASPAVATGGSNDVIVLAADVLSVASPGAAPTATDGIVYAIRDDGDGPTVLWTFHTGHAIGASSPAVGADGTIYIGRQGNTVVDGQLVNQGGALYAIH
jgi:outer membrane protein assembly factor BamB